MMLHEIYFISCLLPNLFRRLERDISIECDATNSVTQYLSRQQAICFVILPTRIKYTIDD